MRGSKADAANLLTRDEARRIALNIAKLPELVALAVADKRDEVAAENSRCPRKVPLDPNSGSITECTI